MMFAKEVLSVISFLRTKNPFLPQNDSDLVTLHTRKVMSSAITEALCNAYQRGKDLHEAFVGVRLRKGSVFTTDTIKRSAFQTFERRTDEAKKRNRCTALKTYITLSLSCRSVQTRPDFDLDYFFKFECHREAPSLFDQGKFKSGTKSDILLADIFHKI